MNTVYALSDKGERECATPSPTLPAALADLLRLIDGQRTRHQLLAVAGKNALTAGGLRWLNASGYIQVLPAYAPAPAPAPAPTLQGASFAAPCARTDREICQALSGFIVQAIRRHLGEAGYAHRRQIERASSVAQLLPHLTPLINAIAQRAGREAAAEFADTAAFILSPRELDPLLG